MSDDPARRAPRIGRVARARQRGEGGSWLSVVIGLILVFGYPLYSCVQGLLPRGYEDPRWLRAEFDRSWEEVQDACAAEFRWGLPRLEVWSRDELRREVPGFTDAEAC